MLIALLSLKEAQTLHRSAILLVWVTQLRLKKRFLCGQYTASLKTTMEPTAGKKVSLLAYVRENKQRYPDCIILTRVGDFYETYGTDAVLLVEVREIAWNHCDCGYIYLIVFLPCVIYELHISRNCSIAD